jgi:hypothetical protein
MSEARIGGADCQSAQLECGGMWILFALFGFF